MALAFIPKKPKWSSSTAVNNWPAMMMTNMLAAPICGIDNIIDVTPTTPNKPPVYLYQLMPEYTFHKGNPFLEKKHNHQGNGPSHKRNERSQ